MKIPQWYPFPMRRWLLPLLGLSLLPLSACDPGSSPEAEKKIVIAPAPATTNPLYPIPYAPPAVKMGAPKAGAVTATTQNKLLGRGVNLGNSLDAPNEGDWGPMIEPWMFEVAAKAGFDSIRLPVRWSTHALEKAPYTIDKAFFARVDWAIAHALSRNLTLVLDVHHYVELFKFPAENHDRFMALWKQIAEHYANYPAGLYFEILNEPNGAIQAEWNKYVIETMAIIRKSNPGRTVVIGGNEFNKWYKLADVTFPPGDKNIIATFHYYRPFCLTHQQPVTWEVGCRAAKDTANVVNSDVAKTWPVLFPDSKDPKADAKLQQDGIAKDLADAAAWSKETGIPLYMGEFGVRGKPEYGHENLTPPKDSVRGAWAGYLVQQAEKNGISWAYWDLAADFYAWDTTTMAWSEPLIEGLIPGYKPSTSTPAPTGSAATQ